MADPEFSNDDDEYVPGPGIPFDADPGAIPGVTINNGPMYEARSEGTTGDDTFYPKGGHDFITTYGGRDTIVVTPEIHTVWLLDFNPAKDTVVFTDFANLKTFDDVKFPYLSFIPSPSPSLEFLTIMPEGSGKGGYGSVVFHWDVVIEYLNPDNIKFDPPEGRINATATSLITPPSLVERDLDEPLFGSVGLVGLDDRTDFAEFTN
jgi:hypothetical protein